MKSVRFLMRLNEYRKVGEVGMTWGELDKYAMRKLTEGINDVIDWRPAVWLHINDIVKAEDNEAFIPFGIRYWLENGDSIIYVKAHEGR